MATNNNYKAMYQKFLKNRDRIKEDVKRLPDYNSSYVLQYYFGFNSVGCIDLIKSIDDFVYSLENNLQPDFQSFIQFIINY